MFNQGGQKPNVRPRQDDRTWLENMKLRVIESDYEMIKGLLRNYRNRKMHKKEFNDSVRNIKKREYNQRYYYHRVISKYGAEMKKKMDKIKVGLIPADFYEWFEVYTKQKHMKISRDQISHQLKRLQGMKRNIRYRGWRLKVTQDKQTNFLFAEYSKKRTTQERQEFLKIPRNQRIIPFVKELQEIQVQRKMEKKKENEYYEKRRNQQMALLQQQQHSHTNTSPLNNVMSPLINPIIPPPQNPNMPPLAHSTGKINPTLMEDDIGKIDISRIGGKKFETSTIGPPIIHPPHQRSVPGRNPVTVPSQPIQQHPLQPTRIHQQPRQLQQPQQSKKRKERPPETTNETKERKSLEPPVKKQKVSPDELINSEVFQNRVNGILRKHNMTLGDNKVLDQVKFQIWRRICSLTTQYQRMGMFRMNSRNIENRVKMRQTGSWRMVTVTGQQNEKVWEDNNKGRPRFRAEQRVWETKARETQKQDKAKMKEKEERMKSRMKNKVALGLLGKKNLLDFTNDRGGDESTTTEVKRKEMMEMNFQNQDYHISRGVMNFIQESMDVKQNPNIRYKSLYFQKMNDDKDYTRGGRHIQKK